MRNLAIIQGSYHVRLTLEDTANTLLAYIPSRLSCVPLLGGLWWANALKKALDFCQEHISYISSFGDEFPENLVKGEGEARIAEYFSEIVAAYFSVWRTSKQRVSEILRLAISLCMHTSGTPQAFRLPRAYAQNTSKCACSNIYVYEDLQSESCRTHSRCERVTRQIS